MESIAKNLPASARWSAVHKDLMSRNTARDMSATKRVHVSSKAERGNRYVHITEVFGTVADVKDHAAWIVQNSTCTPMYEHMLHKASSIDLSPCGEFCTLTIRKNNYAGD